MKKPKVGNLYIDEDEDEWDIVVVERTEKRKIKYCVICDGKWIGESDVMDVDEFTYYYQSLKDWLKKTTTIQHP